MANEKTVKIRIIEDACILTSQLKLEDIKRIEKVCPKALSLYTTNEDGDLEELFKVATGKTAIVSNYGIVFTKANKQGYAMITTLFPANTKDKKQWVLDNYAKVLFMLKDVERNVTEELERINDAYTKLENEIEEE
jgi:hypothetical protein